MEGLVKLIGIIILACGVVFFVKPNLMKKMAAFFTKDKWLYFGGVLNLTIGIIFLRAAANCANSWFVALFGLLALIKGIAIFALGQKKIKALIDKLMKKTPKDMRIVALVYIALGVMLIYAV